MPATRVEIVAHVGGAFSGAPVTRDELVTAAVRSGARDEVVRALRTLPDARFHDIRELWPTLPDVPVEPAPTETTAS